jgi:hypothetical protein
LRRRSLPGIRRAAAQHGIEEIRRRIVRNLAITVPEDFGGFGARFSAATPWRVSESMPPNRKGVSGATTLSEPSQ